MMDKAVLIIGAGKIGRGFIAHLFYRSGYKIWLLDASKEVVELLDREKQYRIDIAGDSEDAMEYVRVEGALHLDDQEQVAQVLSKTDLIASSVGASNIESIAEYMKPLLASRGGRPLNWIICENATHPAKTIKDILLRNADEPAADRNCQAKLIPTMWPRRR